MNNHGYEKNWCEIVITKSLKDEGSVGDHVATSFVMDAFDYTDKEHFVAAAKKKMGDILGDENPALRYQFSNGNFNASQYISENEISGGLWDIAGIDIDDIDIIYAYQEAFGTSTAVSPAALLKDIKSQDLLIGYFATISKMAEAYLSNSGIDGELLELVEPYINFAGLGEAIMREKGIKEAHDFYFTSKEEELS